MTSIDMLSQLQTDTAALRLRLQTLTAQTANGKVITKGAGDIAPQLPRAQNLSSQISRLGTYNTVVGQALGQTAATQTVLSQLGSIAKQFSDTVAMQLDPSNPEAVTFAANQAKAAMVQVGHLLNQQYQGSYLFGGSDSANQPVPDPEGLPTSGMATQIAAAIGTLGGGNSAAVAATTLAAAQSDTAGVTPFSAFLSDPASGLAEPRRSIPAGDGQNVAYGLFANRNAAATSSGDTTGSWVRDLLRGLASIAALTPAQASQTADFNSMASEIRNGLQAARNGLADETGALGLTETRLSDTQSQNSTLVDALKSQLSNITDVDMAATLTDLQQTQTTLQASYTALGRLGSLTLSAYLK
jgi:flagellin-like hook-associated protein FlgL